MSDNNVLSLFDKEEIPAEWEKEWQNMPEYIQENNDPFQSVIVHFRNESDRKEFESLIGQKMTYKTKSIWFPEYDKEKPSNFLYVGTIKDEQNEE